jgi:putative endonuclease
MHDAISREKQLKRWHRQWKINLIESDNPHWVDLAPSLGLPPLPSC